MTKYQPLKDQGLRVNEEQFKKFLKNLTQVATFGLFRVGGVPPMPKDIQHLFEVLRRSEEKQQSQETPKPPKPGE